MTARYWTPVAQVLLDDGQFDMHAPQSGLRLIDAGMSDPDSYMRWCQHRGRQRPG